MDNLIEAWENAHFEETKNYEHTKGEPKVDFIKTNWVVDLPKVLVLQLNRSDYSPVEGPFKKCHRVPIPQTINPAKFLYKNKKEVESINSRQDEMN